MRPSLMVLMVAGALSGCTITVQGTSTTEETPFHSLGRPIREDELKEAGYRQGGKSNDVQEWRSGTLFVGIKDGKIATVGEVGGAFVCQVVQRGKSHLSLAGITAVVKVALEQRELFPLGTPGLVPVQGNQGEDAEVHCTRTK